MEGKGREGKGREGKGRWKGRGQRRREDEDYVGCLVRHKRGSVNSTTFLAKIEGT